MIRVSNTATTNIGLTDLDPVETGIGGMLPQMKMISRRVFATRGLASDLVEKLGIKHNKGYSYIGPGHFARPP
jgi:hypothetical protein